MVSVEVTAKDSRFLLEVKMKRSKIDCDYGYTTLNTLKALTVYNG